MIQTEQIVWTVFDKGQDINDWYFCRKFVNQTATNVMMFSSELNEVRKFLKNMKLKKYDRIDSDAPNIIEFWV